ncbi:MAG: hypothetical protein APG12_01660 [Candidatus Methanofastidiosum methylothiophilum]|uniref:Uncharacterized protein n=1 Tax=Candidatus Methanofastidiosum methylothiophilum TaxID=1705564 RepID=A0A150IVU2_9EURY|nr:MAG: hypothetical protein APG10_01678 [Candidatus Methanofastidiosum methylthiophilus]KYC46691.1 MAG: hypothetical protein APG11_01733 [Candidatus Methanofastidiosum methylthiophilus]KYC49131.1 MAG: hypothetical protein APG12_01660 [Candidatus Methanofastidiosum methylthiophilus]
MKKLVSLLIIGIFAISLLSGCLETSYVNIYPDHVEGCQTRPIIYGLGLDPLCMDQCGSTQNPDCETICANYPLPIQVTLPYTFSVPRCSPNNAREDFKNARTCMDYSGCTPGQECDGISCSTFLLPSNYRCQVVGESYKLEIGYNGTIYVNGTPFGIPGGSITVTFLDRPEEDPDVNELAIIGIPSSITITGDGQGTAGIKFSSICCYECREKSIPAAILYPKIDIEAFKIVGGDTIIQDGKVISSFNISPGTQQTEIQIENRGFFTQNDVRVRVDGLPKGITLDLDPGVQKIKAHKIGTYKATFTVDPDVSSGRYPVVMTAFSLNGTFDRILVEIVVP